MNKDIEKQSHFTFKSLNILVCIGFSLLLLVLSANWIAAISKFQINLPFWDQWDFMEPLFKEKNWLEFFNYKHGPHRQGVGFVLTSLIIKITHWDVRIEGLWNFLNLFVGVLLILLLKIKLSRKLSWWDAWIPIGGLSLLQNENILIVCNSCHSITPFVLLGLIALSWIWMKSPYREIVCGILILLTTFSGFGLFGAVAWSGIFLWELLRYIDKKKSKKILPLTVGFSIVTIGWFLFFMDYTPDPASPGFEFPHDPWTDYLRFISILYAVRFGFLKDTLGTYLIGYTAITTFLIVLFLSLKNLLKGQNTAQNSIIIAFITTSLLFATFTAVGRVHLGICGGVASRYTTITYMAWWGIGMYALSSKIKPLKYVILGLCWASAICPMIPTLDQPVSKWPGTFGLPDDWTKDLYLFKEKRLAWANSMMITGDWRTAEKNCPQAVHPRPEQSDFDRKIKWLKNKKYSIFSEGNWFPWWYREDVAWVVKNGELHDLWIGEYGKAVLNPGLGKFVNIKIRRSNIYLDPNPQLGVKLGDNYTIADHDQIMDGISLPVSSNIHLIEFISENGAKELNPPIDKRLGSFLFDEVSRSKSPKFKEYEWSTGKGPLIIPAFFEIVSGFYGWEKSDNCAWGGETVVFKIKSKDVVYLNINIQKRFEPVNKGDIIVQNQKTFIIPQNTTDSCWSFSLKIEPSSSVREITIRNTGGAMSPNRIYENNDDARELAMLFSKIAVNKQPLYNLIQ